MFQPFPSKAAGGRPRARGPFVWFKKGSEKDKKRKGEKEKKRKRGKPSINHNEKGPYDLTAEETYTGAAKTSEKSNPGPVQQFILRTTMKTCGIT